jgi:hypothetical protein
MGGVGDEHNGDGGEMDGCGVCKGGSGEGDGGEGASTRRTMVCVSTVGEVSTVIPSSMLAALGDERAALSMALVVVSP